MKFHHLGRCVAAVAVALTAWPTMAQEAEGTSAKSTLLQSEIEVTWQDKAQGLAQLLADRLGVPFTSPVPLDTQVSVKQAGGSTVANLISTVNSQLPPGIKLQLTETAAGTKLEAVAASAPTTAVATAVVQGSAPSRAQIEGLFTTSAVPGSGLWVDQARQHWKASFTDGSGQPARRWELKLQDVTLNKAFTRWAAEAGYRVRWDARKHVVIGSPETYEMPFEQAVTAALSSPGIQASEYPLDVCFYPNNPPLARITRRGEQDKECTQ